MPSSHLILCRPLLLLSSIFPSIRIFSSESVLCIRWPKYWSFSFSFSHPMNIQGWFLLGWTGLILQSKGLSRVFSNTTVQKHQFFGTQLSLWSKDPMVSFYVRTCVVLHSYMTTGKTKALIRWTFVSKVMSLLFNMLSRLVIAFLPRSKHVLISWLQSPSAVILEPKKTKSVTVSIVSPSICHEVIGPDAMNLVFRMLGFNVELEANFFTLLFHFHQEAL